MSNYILKSKYVTGGNIIGYEIVDENGKVSLIKKSLVLDLAENGQIKNWGCIKDSDGEKHLVSNLNSLLDIDNTEICEFDTKVVGAIKKDGKVIGYKCEWPSGKIKEYPISKFWELASKGFIAGVKAVRNEDGVYLISDNNILTTLSSN